MNNYATAIENIKVFGETLVKIKNERKKRRKQNIIDIIGVGLIFWLSILGALYINKFF